MQGLCAEKNATGPRKRLNYSTLQSIVDKESTNRGQARATALKKGPRSALDSGRRP